MNVINHITFNTEQVSEHKSLIEECYQFSSDFFNEFDENDFFNRTINPHSSYKTSIISLREEKSNTSKIQGIIILTYFKIYNTRVVSGFACKEKGIINSEKLWQKCGLILIQYKAKHFLSNIYFLNLIISPLTYCAVMSRSYKAYPHPKRKVPKRITLLLEILLNETGKNYNQSNVFLGCSYTRSLDNEIDWLEKKIRPQSRLLYDYYLKMVPNKKQSNETHGLYCLTSINLINIFFYKSKSYDTNITHYFHALRQFITKKHKKINKLELSYKTKINTIREHNTSQLSSPSMATRTIKDEEGNVILSIDPSVFGIKKNSLLDAYTNNSGDPWHELHNVTRDTKKFERDIINMMAQYLTVNPSLLRGHVTSGGTESNICAFWYAREYLSHNNIKNTAFIYCDNAHYSINKAINILNLNPFVIKHDKNNCIDLKMLNETMKQLKAKEYSRFIFNLTLGTTYYGAIDDVVSTYKIITENLNKNQFYIHLDASSLGLLLPILKLFSNNNIFYYIDSLSISSHKLIGTMLISSIFLVKSDILNKLKKNSQQNNNHPFNFKDTTITGSRSGFNIIELHYLLKKMRIDTDAIPLRLMVKKSLSNAKYFYNKAIVIIDKKYITYNPNQFNIVFPQTSPSLATDNLISKYSLIPLGKNLFVVQIFPQISRKLIDEFFKEYQHTISMVGLVLPLI